MHPSPTTVRDEATAVSWTTWHLHLASRAGSVYDRVALDVVAPVVRAHPDRPWFFLRYWQGGPHLRLRIGDLGPHERETIEQDLEARLAVAGALGPDEAPLDPADYRESAARLLVTETERPGGAEGVDDLRPPGVHRASYVPEVARYGGPEFVPATEHLFQLSSELGLALLPHAPDVRRRAALAVRATVSAAAATGGLREQERFYTEGLAFWRTWVAAGSGIDDGQIDRLCDVGQGARRPDPDAHGPFAAWHARLGDLARDLEDTGRPPGPVLLSHVHMFCNRIGRSLVDDMQTYAWLAGATSPGSG